MRTVSPVNLRDHRVRDGAGDARLLGPVPTRIDLRHRGGPGTPVTRHKRQKSARDLLGHAEGAPLSPYVSTTKQEDGEIRNPKGTKFDKRGDGSGKVRIDLAYISPKNIHDVSTRKGQDFWNFSNPAAGTAAMQALKDVVRTSEVLIRGTIPGKAIIEFF